MCFNTDFILHLKFFCSGTYKFCTHANKDEEDGRIWMQYFVYDENVSILHIWKNKLFGTHGIVCVLKYDCFTYGTCRCWCFLPFTTSKHTHTCMCVQYFRVVFVRFSFTEDQTRFNIHTYVCYKDILSMMKMGVRENGGREIEWEIGVNGMAKRTRTWTLLLVCLLTYLLCSSSKTI